MPAYSPLRCDSHRLNVVCNARQGVDGAELLSLSEDRLKQLGLKRANAAALLAATAKLREQAQGSTMLSSMSSTGATDPPQVNPRPNAARQLSLTAMMEPGFKQKRAKRAAASTFE